MLYQSIQAEFKKSRHTFALLMTLSGAFLIPVISFLIYFFRWRYFIPPDSTNAWNELIDFNLSLSAGLFFPFFVILIVAFNLALEHKANSWKQLYVLPVKRSTLFWGKLLFLAVQLFFCVVLLFCTIPLSGLLLGLIHPELAFLSHSLDISYLLALLIRLYICLIAMLSIQFFISLAFDNLIASITIGTMLLIISIILVQGWEYVRYDPYAFSLLLSRRNTLIIPPLFGLPRTELLSLGYFISVSWPAMVYFKRKRIK